KPDEDAQEEEHVPKLMKRLANDLPIVVFVNDLRGNTVGVAAARVDLAKAKQEAMAYTNGTWFEMISDDTGKLWQFTHCATYFRCVFKGTTEEMRQVVVDVLSGKKAAPPVDMKARPGFGPEIRAPRQAPR